jgi:hypothetical protein
VVFATLTSRTVQEVVPESGNGNGYTTKWCRCNGSMDDDSNLEDQPTVTVLNAPSSLAIIKTVVNDGALITYFWAGGTVVIV